jgi:PAS domain S-box-containing protein
MNPEPHPLPRSHPDALREIVAGVAAATGEAFFDALVQHLARALRVKCAWVTEWHEAPRRLRALSFWVDGRYVADYEYAIAGTPCEPVITNRQLTVVADQVVELFPQDPDLAPLGAVSYMGQPLLDTDGRILGNLAVLDDRPLHADATIQAIFSIFTVRAAAELGRVRRDRALQEREAKLSLLIDSAMDAILELDGDFTLTRINPAGEALFQCRAATALGQPVRPFFSADSLARLHDLASALTRQPQGQQSLWIPDGLAALRADGRSFPADATLSRFELAGSTYFTLILRNVAERLQAQERIRSLTHQADYLRAELEALRGVDEILGESEAVRRLRVEIDQVAGADATVLITGETGTGKELIARAIHQRGTRQDRPLIKVNCAAIAANLQESEFFGHEKGAFTGALQRRDGRFKLADGGTLFLDEVGEMALDLQAKLLRVLQEGEYERVGGSRTEKIDVRIIAATNRDLAQRVKDGAFRQDLWYRLNVFPIHAPPLRARGADVLLLAEAFARRLARQRGRPVAPLTPEWRAKLQRYDWPGNIRELQNVIERALITAVDGRTLNLARALPEANEAPPADRTCGEPPRIEAANRILTVAELADFERANLRRALEAARWKLSGPEGAAARLGLHPNTLASRLKALGIHRPSES